MKATIHKRRILKKNKKESYNINLSDVYAMEGGDIKSFHNLSSKMPNMSREEKLLPITGCHRGNKQQKDNNQIYCRKELVNNILRA